MNDAPATTERLLKEEIEFFLPWLDDHFSPWTIKRSRVKIIIE